MMRARVVMCRCMVMPPTIAPNRIITINTITLHQPSVFLRSINLAKVRAWYKEAMINISVEARPVRKQKVTMKG